MIRVRARSRSTSAARPAARPTFARGSTSRASGPGGGQVDNVLMGDPEICCSPLPGGLVVGNVLNANNGNGLNGATVENLSDGGSTETFATPNDPNQPDGLYILFSESGSNDLKASLAQYGSDQHTVLVIPNGTVRRDFTLQSGNVSVDSLAARRARGPGRYGRAGPHRQEHGRRRGVVRDRRDQRSAADLEDARIRVGCAAQAGAGALLQGFLQPRGPGAQHQGSGSASEPASGRHGPWPTATSWRPIRPGITFGWGVASSGSNFWLSNLGVGGGDDKDYQYDSATGAQTGNVDERLRHRPVGW